MYELEQISDTCYYVNCPAKVGIYVPDGSSAYLIDSGNDKDAGRKVRQILDKNGWQLAGILNTHSNADHIGGNHYLQKQTGCPVYAGGIEGAFTKYPILEPSFLYGGYPCQDLRHKFLLAQESETSEFTAEGFPKEVEVISLPGHFFHMVGFRMPDNTVFLGDCISSKATLEKYGVTFIYDVGAYLETLEKVAEMPGAVFVPAHAEVGQDLKDLVAANREKVWEIAGFLLETCRTPMIFERILQAVFQRYQLTMNFEQYVLVGSTIRSYLAWLKDNGKMAVAFDDGLLLWQAV
ncbi:MAG: MBL fold metallo-hydrolase [Peptococcaceae bacterium]|nr:MBL fold metallo-hydrolase [Peptococcaceae bacterium]